MNKIAKASISLISVASIILVSGTNAFAFENANEPQYVETHTEINLENVDLAVANNQDLIISVDESQNFIDKYIGEKNAEKITDLIEEYPNIENNIIDMIDNNEDIVAIGCTEAPVILIDGNLERIEINKPDTIIDTISMNAEASSYKESNEVTKNKGNLALSTWVSRCGYNKNTKKYTYVSHTTATWSKNSAIGGSNYPASGYDYIASTVPKNFTITKDVCHAVYKSGNKELNGKEGTDFWSFDGSNNYTVYELKDDPVGPRQLKTVGLTITSKASSNKNDKRISSYYFHTWKKISMDISVSANTTKEVTLSFSPSVKEKNWKLYSYVNFNF